MLFWKIMYVLTNPFWTVQYLLYPFLSCEKGLTNIQSQTPKDLIGNNEHTSSDTSA